MTGDSQTTGVSSPSTKTCRLAGVVDEQRMIAVMDEFEGFWNRVGSERESLPSFPGLILDLTSAEFVSSAALGKIIRLHQKAHQVGKSLTLIVPEFLRETMALTKLDRMLHIHPTSPISSATTPPTVPLPLGAKLDARMTPPTFEEAHAEWLRYHHVPAKVIDPDLSHSGQFVAFFEGKPQGYDADPTELRKRTAEVLKVHPDRLVISYLG